MFFSDRYIEIENSLVAIVILLPLCLNAKRIKLFKNFSFNLLVATINGTFLIHVLIGLLLMLTSYIFSEWIDSGNQLNSLTEIICGSTFSYVFVGLFFYIPFIALINLIRYISVRMHNSKK